MKYKKFVRFFYRVEIVFYVDLPLVEDFVGLEIGEIKKNRAYREPVSRKYYLYLKAGTFAQNKKRYSRVPNNYVIRRKNITLIPNFSHKTAYLYVTKIYHINKNALEGLINLIIAEFLWTEGMLLMHAACVAKNKQAILIPGLATAGKTCTMFYLLKAGFSPISEDISILYKKNGHIFVYGLKQKIKIKRYSLILFPELAKLRKNNKGITEIEAREYFPQPREQSCRVNFICIPKANFLSKTFGKNIDIKLRYNVFIFLISAANIFFPDEPQRINAKLAFLSTLVKGCKTVPFYFGHDKQEFEKYARQVVNRLDCFIN